MSIQVENLSKFYGGTDEVIPTKNNMGAMFLYEWARGRAKFFAREIQSNRTSGTQTF